MVLLQGESAAANVAAAQWANLVSLLGRLHAPEPDVRHAGVRAAPVPGPRPVAGAIIVVAEERPALLHPRVGPRVSRVEGFRRSLWIDEESTAGPLPVQVRPV